MDRSAYLDLFIHVLRHKHVCVFVLNKGLESTEESTDLQSTHTEDSNTNSTAGSCKVIK